MKRINKSGLFLLALLVTLLSACQVPEGAVQKAPNGSPPAVLLPTEVPTAQLPAPAATPAWKLAAQAAMYHLAERLGVLPEEVELLSVEEVEWPDASLGCPQPGLAYAQVITPGFRITLAVGGQNFIYNTDLGGQAVSCPPQGAVETPMEPTTVHGPGDLPGETPAPPLPDEVRIFGPASRGDLPPAGIRYLEAAVAAVREDLAQRLGVYAEAVVLTEAAQTEVSMAAPCGERRGRPEIGPLGDGLTLGYAIELQVREAVHLYMASGGLAYYCGPLP